MIDGYTDVYYCDDEDEDDYDDGDVCIADINLL